MPHPENVMNLRSLFTVFLMIGITSSAWPLTPSRDYVPPTYAQRWDKSAIVVSGRVTRLQRTEVSNGQTHFEMSLQIERSWKGDLTGELIFKDILPDGFTDQGYPFLFDKTYVIFANPAQEKGFYKRVIAYEVAAPFPLTSPEAGNSLAAIFGSPTTEKELTEFLETKTGNLIAANKFKDAREKAEEAKQAQERARLAFIDECKKDFAAALEEHGVLARIDLLEKLQRKSNPIKEMKEIDVLQGKITSELSVAKTYAANGLKKFD